ncbi:hypothetical protein B0O99DRAFT_594144 [Bisporella sp. PMI_857]|nr:hypothetical protein B0O99DRAFT_594144 [Bisporella sp. PMI_857]
MPATFHRTFLKEEVVWLGEFGTIEKYYKLTQNQLELQTTLLRVNADLPVCTHLVPPANEGKLLSIFTMNILEKNDRAPPDQFELREFDECNQAIRKLCENPVARWRNGVKRISYHWFVDLSFFRAYIQAVLDGYKPSDHSRIPDGLFRAYSGPLLRSQTLKSDPNFGSESLQNWWSRLLNNVNALFAELEQEYGTMFGRRLPFFDYSSPAPAEDASSVVSSSILPEKPFGGESSDTISEED